MLLLTDVLVDDTCHSKPTVLPAHSQERQQRVPCQPLALRASHIGDQCRLVCLQGPALNHVHEGTCVSRGQCHDALGLVAAAVCRVVLLFCSVVLSPLHAGQGTCRRLACSCRQCVLLGGMESAHCYVQRGTAIRTSSVYMPTPLGAKATARTAG